MYDTKKITTLLAGLLVSACATQDAFDDYVEDGEAAEDMVYGGGDQIVVPQEEADDDGPSASGDIVLPDPDDDSDDPGGRITWMGSEDGDLVIHATVGANVLGPYPQADHYAIRFIDGGSDAIVALQSAEDTTLDWFISRPASQGEGVTVQAPFPILPDLEICAFWPCKPVQPFPNGDVEGDWLALAMVDTTLQLRGRVGATPLAMDVLENGETLQLSDTPLSDDEQQRLDALDTLLFDVATLAPEVETVHDCIMCAVYGLAITSEIGLCVTNWNTCDHLYKGAKAWKNECGSGCE